MTPNREDYLKIILELGGDTTKVNNKQIVSSLAVSPASVSEMISKLVKEQLVEHSPYQGVWSFIDDNQQNEQLRVSPTFDFSINDHSLGTTLIELNEQQLIVRDHYGYYLTLSYEKMTFYDESTDSTYQIKKIGR